MPICTWISIWLSFDFNIYNRIKIITHKIRLLLSDTITLRKKTSLLLNRNFIFYLKIAFFWLSNADLFYFFFILWLDPCSTCPQTYSPECGSDGVTYNNICHLKCKPKVKHLHAGPCQREFDLNVNNNFYNWINNISFLYSMWYDPMWATTSMLLWRWNLQVYLSLVCQSILWTR